MQQYLNLLNKIYEEGNSKGDRTGTGTISVFGERMEFKMSDGFPLITTRKINPKNFIFEILWYLKENREGNIQWLKDNNVNIWNEWANDENNLGPLYPTQLRNWGGELIISPVFDEENNFINNTYGQRTIDQVSDVVNQIKNNPNSRRIVMSTWNVTDLPKDHLSPQENADNKYMALAPCVITFQFYVADGKLSLQVYQRSADFILGVPNNVAGLSLLLHIFAHSCGLIPDKLIWVGGDTHIYNNHIDGVETQRYRTPGILPTLKINCQPKDVWDYQPEDFEIVDYYPQEHIKFLVSV